jgi:hypothetical protein
MEQAVYKVIGVNLSQGQEMIPVTVRNWKGKAKTDLA